MELAITKPKFALIKDSKVQARKKIYHKITNETRKKLIEMVSLLKILYI
jgi:hypothetical protein